MSIFSFLKTSKQPAPEDQKPLTPEQRAQQILDFFSNAMQDPVNNALDPMKALELRCELESLDPGRTMDRQVDIPIKFPDGTVRTQGKIYTNNPSNPERNYKPTTDYGYTYANMNDYNLDGEKLEWLTCIIACAPGEYFEKTAKLTTAVLQRHLETLNKTSNDETNPTPGGSMEPSLFTPRRLLLVS